MAAQIEVTDRQAVRLIYGASTGSDAFEDCDGKTIFAEEYIWWLEDKVYRAANIMEGVRERAPNNESDAIALVSNMHQAVSMGLAPGMWYQSNRALVEKIAQQARIS
jgi:hypothetical protein